MIQQLHAFCKNMLLNAMDCHWPCRKGAVKNGDEMCQKIIAPHFEIPLARKGKYLYHKHIKRGGVCPVNAKQKEIQT